MHPVLMFSLTAALALSGVAQAQSPTSADDPAAEATEQQVWRGAPIRVDLRLDTERSVRLPGATYLRSGLLGGPVPGLQVQALGDHLYLKAEQPFAATRMIVQSDAGQSILLDLAADKAFAAGAHMEVLSNPNVVAPGVEAQALVTPQSVDKPVGYVALVRHAAQSLYAPERLIPQSGIIARAPLSTGESVHLVRGAHIQAVPVAAWRASGAHSPLWVAAIRLRNTLARPVLLDPRDLRGQWQAASFQHARLGPSGDETDTTTVYLVANRRFEKALGPFAPQATQVTP
ncbi:MAG: TIGR03749 family integrating conjugative element protein [Sedimenticolaceae bacterium]